MKSLKLFFLFIFTCHLSLLLNSQNIETLQIRPGPDDGYDAEIRTDIDHPIWYEDDFISNAWTVSGDSFIQRSLIKFDLSSIPDGAEITNARLSLFCNTTSGHHQLHSGSNSSYLLMITSDWDQYQVVWNTQPATTFENSILLPQSQYQTQDYLDIDVTDQIDFFYKNPEINFGFLMQLVQEQTYAALVFASSNHLDSTKRPLLVIDYIPCEVPDANFSYIQNGNDNSIVSFSVIENNNTSYWWNFGNGYFSDLPQPVFAFQETGIYNVCLTASNDCDAITICDTVNVCNLMDAFFNFEVNGFSVHFHPVSEIENAHYLWNFGDGFSSDLFDPVHVFNDQGNFEVCLNVSNNCNIVQNCDTVRIIEVSSDEKVVYQDINISPNPSDGFVTIKVLTDKISIKGIKIMRITGEIIKEFPNLSLLKNDNFQFDLSGSSEGVYYLIFITDKGNINRKITIIGS